MPSIHDWSKTPASNNTADSAINWSEGQLPSTVNDSARQMMGRVAELIDDIGAVATTTNVGNAYSVTIASPITAFAAALVASCKINAANTGNCTLNVTGASATGAQPLLTAMGDQIPAGMLTSATVLQLISTATDWRAVNLDVVNATEIVGLSVAAPSRNILARNGGMEVWQRGTSIAVLASTTAYTADGWYLTTNATQASTAAAVTSSIVQSVRAASVLRNSGQTGTGVMRFAFPLDSDEVYKLRSNTAILSFTAQTGANWSPASGTLSYALYCGTGVPGKRGATAFTGETNPITGTVNLTAGGAAQRVVAALSSSIAAGITQAEVQFFWTPVGTAGAADTLILDDVQLEVATVAITPVFERLAYEDELNACRRLLTRWRQKWIGLVAAVNEQSSASSTLPAMRAVPTVTVTSQTNTARFPSATAAVTDVTADSLTYYYVGVVVGGNDFWFADGLASAEL